MAKVPTVRWGPTRHYPPLGPLHLVRGWELARVERWRWLHLRWRPSGEQENGRRWLYTWWLQVGKVVLRRWNPRVLAELNGHG